MGYKKQVENDSLNKKVIDEVAEELNLSKSKVKHAVQHFFGWQREAFDKLEYKSYLWNHFGTFSIIPDRYEEHVRKENNKRNNKLKKIK